MTPQEIRTRLEDSLAPLRCTFTEHRGFGRSISFTLRDGVGRETPEFSFPLREVQDDTGIDGVIQQVRGRVEREGFRHRR